MTNWYKKAQQQSLILWHATLPEFADEIVAEGFLKPSFQLKEEKGRDYSGWNLPVKGKEYGNLIFLEENKNEAISYADIRLDKLLFNVDFLDELLDNEDDYKYVAVFKIIVMNPLNNKLKSAGINKEYIYEGVIPRQFNNEIYFEGPEFVERTALWQKHFTRLEKYEENSKSLNNDGLV